jgi:uncharacterized protein YaaN involved in tellurite resistance
MTDNQEKQLFKTLETLVSGVQVIQTDVKEIKVTLDKHSQILEKHSKILERLDAKTDTIAEKVMNHEARLTKVENTVEELRGGVH